MNKLAISSALAIGELFFIGCFQMVNPIGDEFYDAEGLEAVEELV